MNTACGSTFATSCPYAGSLSSLVQHRLILQVRTDRQRRARVWRRIQRRSCRTAVLWMGASRLMAPPCLAAPMAGMRSKLVTRRKSQGTGGHSQLQPSMAFLFASKRSSMSMARCTFISATPKASRSAPRRSSKRHVREAKNHNDGDGRCQPLHGNGRRTVCGARPPAYMGDVSPENSRSHCSGHVACSTHRNGRNGSRAGNAEPLTKLRDLATCRFRQSAANSPMGV